MGAYGYAQIQAARPPPPPDRERLGAGGGRYGPEIRHYQVVVYLAVTVRDPARAALNTAVTVRAPRSRARMGGVFGRIIDPARTCPVPWRGRIAESRSAALKTTIKTTDAAAIAPAPAITVREPAAVPAAPRVAVSDPRRHALPHPQGAPPPPTADELAVLAALDDD